MPFPSSPRLTPYMRCRFMSSLASPVTPPTRAHHCLTSQEILCTEYSGHVSPHKARSRDLSRTQFSIHWLTAAKFRVVIDIRKSMVYGLCLCSCTSKFRSQMIIMWQKHLSCRLRHWSCNPRSLKCQHRDNSNDVAIISWPHGIDSTFNDNRKITSTNDVRLPILLYD